MESERKKSSLGPRAIGIIIILTALAVWGFVGCFRQNHRQFLKGRLAEQQADSLVVSIIAFKQLTGTLPLSLADKLPDGRAFFVLLPEQECFANSFTGLRTEPRFFDRLHEKADKGTIAVTKENGRYYVVVYDKSEKVCRKIRL